MSIVTLASSSPQTIDNTIVYCTYIFLHWAKNNSDLTKTKFNKNGKVLVCPNHRKDRKIFLVLNILNS